MKNKKTAIIILLIIIIIAIIATITTKKIQKENRKYEIAQITEYKYFVLKENDKYGVINTQGETIIEPKYEDIKIPNPEKAIFICYENNSTKILNDKQEQIYTQYQDIQPLRLTNVISDLMYEKTTLKYSQDEKYGIIDIDGKKITDPIYEEINTLQFKEGELLVKKDGKYGIINIKGTTLVKPQYDGIEVDKYYEEATGYKKSGYIVKQTTDEGYRYGYVNIDGKQIMDNKYNDLYRITDIDSQDVYIICAENGKYGLFKNGKKVIENEYQALTYNQSNNTITALKGKKYGVISIDGNTLVPFEYKQIDTTGEYIYAKTEEENTQIFDSKGKEANINSDTAILNVENTEYKIHIETKQGKTIYKIYKNDTDITKNEDYIYVEYLYDNYFIACNSEGKLGIIDDNNKTKVEFNYNSIQKIDGTNLIQTVKNDTNTVEIYSKELTKITELKNATIEKKENYIRLYNNDEIKYVTEEGKEVKNTQLLKDNKIFASKNNGKWGFVDKNGNIAIGYDYEYVTEVNQYGFAGIKQNGLWGVVDSEGKIVVKPKYKLNDTEPTFIGEYYQVTYGNGERYYTNM